MLEATDQVPGATKLLEWFGYWPSFHDAEVLGLELCRTGSSKIRIHTWEMTDQVNEQGSFTCVKHVVVTFILEQVTNLHLDDFSSQNVISGLLLRHTDNGYELTLEPCYGLAGTITADRLEIELRPGIPEVSQYEKL